MSVVGLDLSLTASGVAWGGLPTDVRTIVTKPPKAIDGQTKAQRAHQVRSAAMDRIGDIWRAVSDEGPVADSGWPEPYSWVCDLVVVEHYSLHSKGSQLASLAELGGCIRQRMSDAGVEYIEVPPSTLKKFATGKGNANKVEMVLAASRRLGYLGSDDNEADALWLREIGFHLTGHLAATTLPKAHMDALDKLRAVL